MICNNCGNKISDDSKFCYKCGNKTTSKHNNKLKPTQKLCNRCGSEISSDAVFCYKCGNNTSGVNFDETNSYITENNNEQTDDISKVDGTNQSAEQQNFDFANISPILETNKKNNNTKIFIASLIGIAIVIMIANINEKIEMKTNTTTTVSNRKIQLTQTYKNEVEGMSFNYPEGWSKSQYIPYDDNRIVYFKLSTEQSDYIIMDISKIDTSLSASNLWALSESRVNELPKNVIKIQKKVDTNIDGLHAIKTIYVTTDGYTGISYFYILKGDVYHVNFYTYNEKFDEYCPIFDAIMETYDISFPNN